MLFNFAYFCVGDSFSYFEMLVEGFTVGTVPYKDLLDYWKKNDFEDEKSGQSDNQPKYSEFIDDEGEQSSHSTDSEVHNSDKSDEEDDSTLSTNYYYGKT